MGCLGNLIWFLCGGAVGAIGWFVAGIIWCVSIVGLPIGLQCFKFATLSLFPFGREVKYGGGIVSLFMNIIWLLSAGIPLALHHLFWGVVLCISIIGAPFGMQHFKLAKLALMPFGAEV